MKPIQHFFRISVLSLASIAVFACSSGAPMESVDEHQDELRWRRACAGPRDHQCPDDRYCAALRPGRCPGEEQIGVCMRRPEVCTDEFNPVCGCDGVTYPNACNAAAVGVAVASRGECVTDPGFCGGIAGFPCPAGQTCIDDPSDDCDPANGGADCGGICVTETNTFCGGIAGIPCPADQTCIDDPSDDCDPANGGADCGGICVTQTNPCAAVLCPVGSECVVDGDQASCVPVGTCGDVVCAPGLVCCNPLLGICRPPGGVCIF
jgi:hypothetical protein